MHSEMGPVWQNPI